MPAKLSGRSIPGATSAGLSSVGAPMPCAAEIRVTASSKSPPLARGSEAIIGIAVMGSLVADAKCSSNAASASEGWTIRLALVEVVAGRSQSDARAASGTMPTRTTCSVVASTAVLEVRSTSADDLSVVEPTGRPNREPAERTPAEAAGTVSGAKETASTKIDPTPRQASVGRFRQSAIEYQDRYTNTPLTDNPSQTNKGVRCGGRKSHRSAQ